MDIWENANFSYGKIKIVNTTNKWNKKYVKQQFFKKDEQYFEKDRRHMGQVAGRKGNSEKI